MKKTLNIVRCLTMKNRKILFDAPFFMFVQKHNCPNCATNLTTKKVKKIVNSKSEEAKDFDFSAIDARFFGDVEFTWYVFYCEHCDIEISCKELKKYEFAKKR